MLNVKFVIAVSFERFEHFVGNSWSSTIIITYRIHRSNLVLFGVLPLQFKHGENVESLGLTGKEQFSIDITNIRPGQEVTVKVDGGKISEFKTIARLDTESEILYYRNGGNWEKEFFFFCSIHRFIQF